MENNPGLDSEVQQGRQYWCLSGPLFKSNKLPTQKLDRLLRGIASAISTTFGQQDNNDLTPTQLSAFYRAVGGDYDPLFAHTPPQSIAFIYKSLGCLHSLQPLPDDNGYTAPCIPALKPKGFVTWQAIQILLGPEEHVPFLQRALKDFNVMDPDDGTPLPKYLPREAFPSHPDENMEKWHKNVSERLQFEAQNDLQSVDSRRSSLDMSTDSHTDERADAAQYFSNPFFKNKHGQPAIVRHITKAPAHLLSAGHMVVHTVRNMADPHLWSGRRRSSPDTDDESAKSENATPTGRPYHRHDHDHDSRRYRSPRRDPRRSPRLSPRPIMRHERSPSDSSASEEERKRPRPTLRRHRSHEPPSSPREYFVNPERERGDNRGQRQQYHKQPQPPQQEQQQQQQQPKKQQPPSQQHQHHHSQSAGDYSNQGFRPTDSPPFAVKVANLQQPAYFDLKGPLPTAARSKQDYSGGRQGMMPSARAAQTWGPMGTQQPSNSNSPTVAGNRPTHSRNISPVRGVDGRRYPTEAPWRC